jgi:phosphopantetheine adenylyltransferase
MTRIYLLEGEVLYIMLKGQNRWMALSADQVEAIVRVQGNQVQEMVDSMVSEECEEE